MAFDILWLDGVNQKKLLQSQIDEYDKSLWNSPFILLEILDTCLT